MAISKNDLLVNIHFSNLHIERVSELYLYYKLRFHAQKFGGCISGFKFTHNEKYKVLPNLKRYGWIKDEYVSNYRKICNRWESIGIWVRMPEDALVSIKAFKGFLISSSEAYILRRNNRLQERKSNILDKRSKTLEKRDWVSRHETNYWFKVKKMSFDGVMCHIGRVYLSTLEEFMGLSKRTLSRWREESSNEYRTKYIKAGQCKSIRDGSMFFNSKTKGYVTIDQYIISDIDIFTISRYKGIDYTYSYRNLKRREHEQNNIYLHYYETKKTKI